MISSVRSTGRVRAAMLLAGCVAALFWSLAGCERAPGEVPGEASPATTTAGGLPSAAATDPAGSEAAVLARGELLVAIMDCDGCHTPRGLAGARSASSRRLAGHPEDLILPPPPDLGDGPWEWVASETATAYAGPWGITFSANLTPDTTTGLGAWTQSMFSRSMRTGRHWGTGREILPPMPWEAYSHLPDGDLHALYVYLRSLPPVTNEVPPYLPSKRARKRE